MCNTSKFQQTRKFNRLAEIVNGKLVKSTQLTPRKFELIIEANSFGDTMRYYVYFGDTEVTFREVDTQNKQWYLLN